MREVTINGKTVTIESGKAPPPIIPGREKSDLRLLCEAMKDGESVLPPIGNKEVQKANLSGIAAAVGARFSYRTEATGVRIYRLAKKSALSAAVGNSRSAAAPQAHAWA